MLTAGCSGGASPNTPATTPEEPSGITQPSNEAISYGGQVVDPATGMAEGVLGIYTLLRDPADPTKAELVMQRSAEAAQGDLYALSVRPYMNPNSLQLQSSAPIGDMTDYTMRFTHPFNVPPDFEPPATASKRLDLFIFDVNLVLAIPGDRLFFNAGVKANVSQVGSMSGYRMLGPLLDLSQVGVTDGTNVFPFRLLHRIDGSNPDGNYDTDGWIQDEFLNATGYDVIPQGSFADGTLRLATSLGSSVKIIVVAKYMDPRGGADAITKRANRLPNDDPANLRYFLPEAAGDLQNMRAQVQGSLIDNSDQETATITVNVLDWDNAAEVAPAFPDPSNLNAISESSKPYQIEASFPDLDLDGTYGFSQISTPSGLINEYVDITIPVTNRDKSYIAPGGGGSVDGLVRVRDEQDATNPQQILLNESLQVQSPPSGFEPSTRFQKVAIPITTGRVAPNVTAVDPILGISGEQVTFTVTNTGGPITSFTWGFGGGASPNTSNAPEPMVTLGAPGTYTCLLRASNDYGSQDFYFSLEVELSIPVITAVNLSTTFALRNCTFTATNTGEPATTWSWDFGGGATPNTSTAESPVVRLAAPGTYTGTVTASNAGGSSDPFEFEFTTVTKKIGVRLTVITSGTTYPKRLQGMAAWDLASFKTWVNTYVSNPFRNAGVEVDPDQVELVPLNNPSLFNIDTQSELDQLWNLALTQNPNKLNSVAINAVPSAPGLGGVMTDASSGCNPNNSLRGCWIICFGEAFDTVVLPHEWGHVMNLPHVRTNTNPVNSNNYNLMSYGTLSNALSASAVREEAASCITYFGPAPVNQFQVSNDWVHTYM